MTVQITVFDGVKRITRTWRNIYRGVNLAELREGFFAQEEHCKWGIMVQLKGTDRLVLGRFGNNDEDDQ